MELYVANGEAVGVCVKVDLARAIKREPLKAQIAHDTDAGAGIRAHSIFEIGLGDDVEPADVGDVSHRDVVNGAIEGAAIAKAFHAGQQADGVRALLLQRSSGDVLDRDVMDGTETGRVAFPLPGVERDGIIVRITVKVPYNPLACGAIYMDTIAPMTIERDAIDCKIADVAEVDSEGPALTHGDITNRYASDVL